MADSIITERWCPRCQTTKPTTQFRCRSDRPGKPRAYCHPCHQQYDRDIRYKTRETRLPRLRAYKNSPRGRDRYYLRNFGITFEVYQRMEREQGGMCAICNRPPVGKGLAVDHDHTTGKVRGLLCVPCNAALGVFNDSIEGLEAAKNYLLKFSAT